MRTITFHQSAFDQYNEWAESDKKIFGRLVYKVTDDQLIIASCKYHYE